MRQYDCQGGHELLDEINLVCTQRERGNKWKIRWEK